MLRYPCLILDHDDTVVQSEATINYPYFCYILSKFRPGQKITLDEYIHACCHQGFVQMCRQIYNFTDEEMLLEYNGWKEYVREHIPSPYPGIDRIIYKHKEEGGILCVVSHSGEENIQRDYKTHFGIVPDDIYGWDLPEEKRKPNTYPLLAIMEKYNLTPQQLLVVDDMKPAYDMAQPVGVKTAFAKWGKQGQADICDQMSRLFDYTFETVADLEAFQFV